MLEELKNVRGVLEPVAWSREQLPAGAEAAFCLPDVPADAQEARSTLLWELDWETSEICFSPQHPGF